MDRTPQDTRLQVGADDTDANEMGGHYRGVSCYVAWGCSKVEGEDEEAENTGGRQGHSSERLVHQAGTVHIKLKTQKRVRGPSAGQSSSSWDAYPEESSLANQMMEIAASAYRNSMQDVLNSNLADKVKEHLCVQSAHSYKIVVQAIRDHVEDIHNPGTRRFKMVIDEGSLDYLLSCVKYVEQLECRPDVHWSRERGDIILVFHPTSKGDGSKEAETNI